MECDLALGYGNSHSLPKEYRERNWIRADLKRVNSTTLIPFPSYFLLNLSVPIGNYLWILIVATFRLMSLPLFILSLK